MEGDRAAVVRGIPAMPSPPDLSSSEYRDSGLSKMRGRTGGKSCIAPAPQYVATKREKISNPLAHSGSVAAVRVLFFFFGSPEPSAHGAGGTRHLLRGADLVGIFFAD